MDHAGHWKIARQVSKNRVISIVDPETRHRHKSRSQYRDGYKAHLVVEPATGLVTAATLTPANVADGSTGASLLAGEAPVQVLADGAYGSGDTRAALREAGHSLAVTPYPTHSGMPGGVHRDDFVVNEVVGTVTCPAGQVATIARAPRGVRTPLRDVPTALALHQLEDRSNAEPERARRRTHRVPSRVARR